MKDCLLTLTASKPALRVSQEPYLDWLTLTGELNALVNMTILIILKHANGSFDIIRFEVQQGKGSMQYGYQEGMAAGLWTCDAIEADTIIPDDIRLVLSEPFAIEVTA